MVKKILISGSNGFVGSVLSNYFRTRGWNVIEATRSNNHKHILFDLDNPEQITNYKLNESVDIFLHLAASNEVTCHKNPFLCISRNVLGTKAALDFSLNNNINKFIYISTFHVFGNPSGKLNELSTPLPSNDYGLSHLQAEEYVKMYARQTSLKTMIIRPTNLYELPSTFNNFNRWTLTPFAFCKDAIQNGEIKLSTSGQQLRNFLSVHDLAKIIEHSISQFDKYPLLHCYGSDTLKIKELAILVQKILSEQFNRHVKVVIPESAVNKPTEFQFESLYLESVYKPTQKIGSFLSLLCKELLTIQKLCTEIDH